MQKIIQKLHAVMSKVDFIPKDKTNEFHNYKYASEYAIKSKLHSLLVEYKVLFNVSILDSLTIPNRKGDGFLTTVHTKYKFIDVDSGESLEGDFWGVGEDKGDKGMYKAITGAIKYILTTSFLIPTGDDVENEPVKNAPEARHTADKSQSGVRCPKCGKPAILRTGASKNGRGWRGVQCSCTKGIQFLNEKKYNEPPAGRRVNNDLLSDPDSEYDYIDEANQ